MSKINFGWDQFKNPTPAAVNKTVRVITVTTSALIGWIASVTFMGAHAKDIIQQCLGLVIILCNVVGPMFGVEVTGKVDAKDVTAIETN